MIRNFRDEETEKIFYRQPSARLSPDIQQTVLRKLRMLNRSNTIGDLKTPPSNRLERLSRDRAGQYGIRINDQWRIQFVWRDGSAHEVAIVYHQGGIHGE
ncbi:MAG TPA: type II toxin-antitoxin system RelE/ParE family toxin [candidate division Zixibacteria bacterium]|nr:type II toxin-antitoxin system RelE/ParE family toxin [candidate division Zixibacteria bacterium]